MSITALPMIGGGEHRAIAPRCSCKLCAQACPAQLPSDLCAWARFAKLALCTGVPCYPWAAR